MKLEDIKIKQDDKITFKNNSVYYVNDVKMLKNIFGEWEVSKVERPKYETIYEKKEILDEPKKIEKISYREFRLYAEIDKYEMYLELAKKINEIIDYINEVKDE